MADQSDTKQTVERTEREYNLISLMQLKKSHSKKLKDHFEKDFNNKD